MTDLHITRILGIAGCAATLAAAGCGGDDATTTTSASQAPRKAAAPHPRSATSLLDAAPAKPYTTFLFKPGLRLELPKGWTPEEFDAGAFSFYPGNDGMSAPATVTFDGALEKRSLASAIARLRSAAGARPGPVVRTRLGRVELVSFAVHPTRTVKFADSGFHTQPGDRLRVGAFRVAGRTVTVFEIAGNAADEKAIRRAAERILRTVRPEA